MKVERDKAGVKICEEIEKTAKSEKSDNREQWEGFTGPEA